MIAVQNGIGTEMIFCRVRDPVEDHLTEVTGCRHHFTSGDMGVKTPFSSFFDILTIFENVEYEIRLNFTNRRVYSSPTIAHTTLFRGCTFYGAAAHQS